VFYEIIFPTPFLLVRFMIAFYYWALLLPSLLFKFTKYCIFDDTPKFQFSSLFYELDSLDSIIGLLIASLLFLFILIVQSAIYFVRNIPIENPPQNRPNVPQNQPNVPQNQPNVPQNPPVPPQIQTNIVTSSNSPKPKLTLLQRMLLEEEEKKKNGINVNNFGDKIDILSKFDIKNWTSERISILRELNGPPLNDLDRITDRDRKYKDSIIFNFIAAINELLSLLINVGKGAGFISGSSLKSTLSYCLGIGFVFFSINWILFILPLQFGEILISFNIYYIKFPPLLIFSLLIGYSFEAFVFYLISFFFPFKLKIIIQRFLSLALFFVLELGIKTLLIGITLSYFFYKYLCVEEFNFDSITHLSILFYWFSGIIMMISFGSGILGLRSILRPELLSFFRSPYDPDFHPIKDMV